MKKLLKRAGVTLLLLVNLFVFLPKTAAADKEANYEWTVHSLGVREVPGMGKLRKCTCDMPSSEPACIKGSTGSGFFGF